VRVAARHYGGRVRDLTYRPLTVAVAAAFRLLRLRVEVTGSEHVPTTGGAVLALNHVSYVDFVLAGIATQQSRRKVRFLAKRELFSSRLTGPLMRSLHHIEVDRTAGSGSFDEAVRYLVAGELVGVFRRRRSAGRSSSSGSRQARSGWPPRRACRWCRPSCGGRSAW